VLGRALAPIAARIFLAFVYGSVAKRSDTAASDIDLFVVSDSVSYQDVFKALEESESKLGRKVNPTLYTAEEFARRRAQGNSFIKGVLAQPKIFLIGNDRALQ
jgi:predicted nucleotidyltransferase